MATLPNLGMIKIHERFPRVQLLVLGDPLVAERAVAWHPARLKHFDDRVRASRRRPTRNRCLEEILVPFPSRRRPQALVVLEVGAPDRPRERVPLSVAPAGESHPFILAGAAEHALRRLDQIAIPLRRRLRTVHHRVHKSLDAEPDRGFPLRHVDELAFARPVPVT
jgi:hypothetical protein